MCATTVDSFYDNITKILSTLDNAKEISLHVWTSDHLRRVLVLVAANYFENEISEIMKKFFIINARSPMIEAFSINAMERNYHTYFDWDNSKNANRFFALFGNDFKAKASNDVSNNTDLSKSIISFLEIGRTRNELTHKRLNEIILPKTAEEYYELYKNSLIFIEYLRHNLK